MYLMVLTVTIFLMSLIKIVAMRCLTLNFNKWAWKVNFVENIPKINGQILIFWLARHLYITRYVDDQGDTLQKRNEFAKNPDFLINNHRFVLTYNEGIVLWKVLFISLYIYLKIYTV